MASIPDGNGLFEYLQVDVEVDVVEAGGFSLQSDLSTASRRVVAWGSVDSSHETAVPLTCVDLGTGVQRVPIYFNGAAIRAWGMDGPFTVSAELLDGPYTVYLDLSDAYYSDGWEQPRRPTATQSSSGPTHSSPARSATLEGIPTGMVCTTDWTSRSRWPPWRGAPTACTASWRTVPVTSSKPLKRSLTWTVNRVRSFCTSTVCSSAAVAVTGRTRSPWCWSMPMAMTWTAWTTAPTSTLTRTWSDANLSGSVVDGDGFHTGSEKNEVDRR